MNIIKDAQNEVNDNYAYFKTKISDLKKGHINKFVLLHKKQIVDFYINEDDAITIGTRDYGEGHFSVQQVSDRAVDLGYQSYVII